MPAAFGCVMDACRSLLLIRPFAMGLPGVLADLAPGWVYQSSFYREAGTAAHSGEQGGGPHLDIVRPWTRKLTVQVPAIPDQEVFPLSTPLAVEHGGYVMV